MSTSNTNIAKKLENFVFKKWLHELGSSRRKKFLRKMKIQLESSGLSPIEIRQSFIQLMSKSTSQIERLPDTYSRRKSTKENQSKSQDKKNDENSRTDVKCSSFKNSSSTSCKNFIDLTETNEMYTKQNKNNIGDLPVRKIVTQIDLTTSTLSEREKLVYVNNSSLPCEKKSVSQKNHSNSSSHCKEKRKKSSNPEEKNNNKKRSHKFSSENPCSANESQSIGTSSSKSSSFNNNLIKKIAVKEDYPLKITLEIKSINQESLKKKESDENGVQKIRRKSKKVKNKEKRPKNENLSEEKVKSDPKHSLIVDKLKMKKLHKKKYYIVQKNVTKKFKRKRNSKIDSQKKSIRRKKTSSKEIIEIPSEKVSDQEKIAISSKELEIPSKVVLNDNEIEIIAEIKEIEITSTNQKTEILSQETLKNPTIIINNNNNNEKTDVSLTDSLIQENCEKNAINFYPKRRQFNSCDSYDSGACVSDFSPQVRDTESPDSTEIDGQLLGDINPELLKSRMNSDKNESHQESHLPDSSTISDCEIEIIDEKVTKDENIVLKKNFQPPDKLRIRSCEILKSSDKININANRRSSEKNSEINEDLGNFAEHLNETMENLTRTNEDLSRMKHLTRRVEEEEEVEEEFETKKLPEGGNLTEDGEEATRNQEATKEIVENVEKRVENVEEPVENVEKPVDNVEKPVENVEKTMDNVEKPVENVFTQKIRVKNPSELGCPRWCPTPVVNEEPVINSQPVINPQPVINQPPIMIEQPINPQQPINNDPLIQMQNLTNCLPPNSHFIPQNFQNPQFILVNQALMSNPHQPIAPQMPPNSWIMNNQNQPRVANPRKSNPKPRQPRQNPAPRRRQNKSKTTNDYSLPMFAGDQGAQNRAEEARRDLLAYVKPFFTSDNTENIRIAFNELTDLLCIVSENTIILRQKYQNRPLGMCSPELKEHNLLLNESLQKVANFLSIPFDERKMYFILNSYSFMTLQPVLDKEELNYIMCLHLRPPEPSVLQQLFTNTSIPDKLVQTNAPHNQIINIDVNPPSRESSPQTETIGFTREQYKTFQDQCKTYCSLIKNYETFTIRQQNVTLAEGCTIVTKVPETPVPVPSPILSPDNMNLLLEKSNLTFESLKTIVEQSNTLTPRDNSSPNSAIEESSGVNSVSEVHPESNNQEIATPEEVPVTIPITVTIMDEVSPEITVLNQVQRPNSLATTTAVTMNLVTSSQSLPLVSTNQTPLMTAVIPPNQPPLMPMNPTPNRPLMGSRPPPLMSSVFVRPILSPRIPTAEPHRTPLFSTPITPIQPRTTSTSTVQSRTPSTSMSPTDESLPIPTPFDLTITEMPPGTSKIANSSTILNSGPNIPSSSLPSVTSTEVSRQNPSPPVTSTNVGPTWKHPLPVTTNATSRTIPSVTITVPRINTTVPSATVPQTHPPVISSTVSRTNSSTTPRKIPSSAISNPSRRNSWPANSDLSRNNPTSNPTRKSSSPASSDSSRLNPSSTISDSSRKSSAPASSDLSRLNPSSTISDSSRIGSTIDLSRSNQSSTSSEFLRLNPSSTSRTTSSMKPSAKQPKTPSPRTTGINQSPLKTTTVPLTNFLPMSISRPSSVNSRTTSETPPTVSTANEQKTPSSESTTVPSPITKITPPSSSTARRNSTGMSRDLLGDVLPSMPIIDGTPRKKGESSIVDVVSDQSPPTQAGESRFSLQCLNYNREKLVRTKSTVVPKKTPKSKEEEPKSSDVLKRTPKTKEEEEKLSNELRKAPKSKEQCVKPLSERLKFPDKEVNEQESYAQETLELEQMEYAQQKSNQKKSHKRRSSTKDEYDPKIARMEKQTVAQGEETEVPNDTTPKESNSKKPQMEKRGTLKESNSSKENAPIKETPKYKNRNFDVRSPRNIQTEKPTLIVPHGSNHESPVRKETLKESNSQKKPKEIPKHRSSETTDSKNGYDTKNQGPKQSEKQTQQLSQPGCSRQTEPPAQKETHEPEIEYTPKRTYKERKAHVRRSFTKEGDDPNSQAESVNQELADILARTKSYLAPKKRHASRGAHTQRFAQKETPSPKTSWFGPKETNSPEAAPTPKKSPNKSEAQKEDSFRNTREKEARRDSLEAQTGVPREPERQKEAPKDRGPQKDAPKERGPQKETPKERGSQNEMPKERGPQKETPKERGPQNETPKERGPQKETPKEKGPQTEAPRETQKESLFSPKQKERIAHKRRSSSTETASSADSKNSRMDTPEQTHAQKNWSTPKKIHSPNNANPPKRLSSNGQNETSAQKNRTKYDYAQPSTSGTSSTSEQNEMSAQKNQAKYNHAQSSPSSNSGQNKTSAQKNRTKYDYAQPSTSGTSSTSGQNEMSAQKNQAKHNHAQSSASSNSGQNETSAQNTQVKHNHAQSSVSSNSGQNKTSAQNTQAKHNHAQSSVSSNSGQNETPAQKNRTNYDYAQPSTSQGKTSVFHHWHASHKKKSFQPEKKSAPLASNNSNNNNNKSRASLVAEQVERKLQIFNRESSIENLASNNVNTTPTDVQNSNTDIVVKIEDEEDYLCLRCKRESYVACELCQKAFYCSKSCQEQHWQEVHYKNCKNKKSS